MNDSSDEDMGEGSNYSPSNELRVSYKPTMSSSIFSHNVGQVDAIAQPQPSTPAPMKSYPNESLGSGDEFSNKRKRDMNKSYNHEVIFDKIIFS